MQNPHSLLCLVFTPFTPDLLIGVLSVERPYSNVRHAPNSYIFKYNFVANKTDKTRNKMRVAIESGKGMKVKVVKLC